MQLVTEPQAGDLEIVPAPEGLDTVIGLLGDGKGANGVGFLAVMHTKHLLQFVL